MVPARFIGIADAENKPGQYTTFMQANGHSLIADEAKEFGGMDLGPTPGDYLCMALASCKAITLRMYVQRKQWKLDNISINVKLAKNDPVPSGLNTFYCEIIVTGNIDSDQQKRLQEIAKVCPISRLLARQNEVIVSVLKRKDPL